MTSAVLLAAIKYGLLSLLWLFIVMTVRTVRSDLTQTAPPVERPSSAAAPPTSTPPTSTPAAAPVRRRSQARRLLVTEGSGRGTSVRLADLPITLGRAGDCTLMLTDDYASNHHARLVPTAEGWLVEDLGSTNGTYLGPAKIVRPTLVPLGHPLRIGKTTLELRR